MSNEIRPNIDSREGFSSDEEMAYHEAPYGWDCIEGDDDEPTAEDLAEMEEYWDEADEDYYDEEYDGQPDEYTEWQDYMGGDDWDQGQYDEY